MKSCIKCGLRKPLDQFNRKMSSADGHRNDCKVCQKYYVNLRYIREPRRER